MRAVIKKDIALIMHETSLLMHKYIIDPLHCILLRMRDKAMSARVAINRSSYYKNEWQKTRKASFFRIITAKFLHK